MEGMYWSALLLGLASSFHCLGMCGPIAMSLHGGSGSKAGIVVERLLYNIGRAATYALMGIMAGLLGQSLGWLVGYQVYLTGILGLLFVLLGIFSVNPDKLLTKAPAFNGWFAYIRKTLGQYMRKAGWHNFFAIGLLNGFLPCGMVYMALLNALAFGSPLEGGSYMFLFGMGTLPMMLAASVAGQYISMSWRNHMRRIYPFIFILMGGMLLFRTYNVVMSSMGQPTEQAEGKKMMCH